MTIEERVLAALDPELGQRWDEVRASIVNNEYVQGKGMPEPLPSGEQVRAALGRLRVKDLAYCGRFVVNEQIWWRRPDAHERVPWPDLDAAS